MSKIEMVLWWFMKKKMDRKLQDATNRKGQFHASGLCFQEPHHSDTKSVILRNKLVITYSFLEHTGFQLNHGLSHV